MDTISLKEKGDQKIQNLIISNINQILIRVFDHILSREWNVCFRDSIISWFFISIYFPKCSGKRNFYKLVIKEAHVCPNLVRSKNFSKIIKKTIIEFCNYCIWIMRHFIFLLFQEPSNINFYSLKNTYRKHLFE